MNPSPWTKHKPSGGSGGAPSGSSATLSTTGAVTCCSNTLMFVSCDTSVKGSFSAFKTLAPHPAASFYHDSILCVSCTPAAKISPS